jgi:segregation and condensation protein B
VSKGAVECLLFVASEPVPLREIARALDCDEVAAEMAICELREVLDERGAGLQVVHIAGGYQLATRPEYAEFIGRLFARGGTKLSRAALETLSIIAYQQPVTQPEIEAVRGVACDGVLKTLLDRRLISEEGRRQTVGRPILYATTEDFLHYFGLAALTDLPPLDDTGEPGERGITVVCEAETVSETESEPGVEAEIP